MQKKAKMMATGPNLFTASYVSGNFIQEKVSTPYQGASFKQSLKEWASAAFTTADEALLPNVQTLRTRSHDAMRNQPAARGAIRTMRKGVIGSSLRLQASIDRDFLKINEEQAQEWQAKTQQEFRIWAENRNCDFSRQLNFAGLQKLAFTSQRVAGDCFVLLPLRPFPGMPYDLRVQIIDADRVCNPNDLGDTAEIAGGIERNEEGIPIAIHIRTPHPAASIYQQLQPTWMRIPIYGRKTGHRNVLHLMSVERIGQTRGEPILSSVIETLKQVSRYSAAELSAAVVNALLTVGIERPLEDTLTTKAFDFEEGKEPWNRSDNYKLGAGTWVDFAPGEKANIISAVRPSSQFDPFFCANIKQIGMALGIPYEVLIKHFSSSYSASRAAMLDFHKDCLDEREDFTEAFCQPIYEEFLTEAVIKGRIKAPGFLTDPYMRLAYSGAYWIGPAQGQIDEVKEVNAAHLRVIYGFSTQDVESQKFSGMSYVDIVRGQAGEKKIEKKYGWHPSEPKANANNSSEEKEDGEKTSEQSDSGDSANPVGNNR
jgi:lambda family phage portal protein